MPTRNTRKLLVSYGVWQKFYPWIGPSVTSTDASVREWVNDTRFVSANHPKWKARLKDGQDVTTVLIANRYRWTPKDTYLTVSYQNAGLKGYDRYIGQSANSVPKNPGVVDTGVVNTATSAAEIAFTKNYRKKTQNWNSGQFCGELLQTARMLASPAKSARKAVTQLYDTLKREILGRRARGNPNSAVRRAIADTYLEWQFGVKPLVQDLDGAAEAFRALASGRCFDTIRITGTGTASSNVPGYPKIGNFASGQAGFPAGSFARAYTEGFDTSEVTIRGAWKNSNPSGEMPIPMRFGTGINDIVPTAWELVPWSFFVDYFINVGDVLDAWSMRFVNFSWVNKTVRNCRTLKGSDLIVSPHGTFDAKGSYGGRVVSQRFDVSRNSSTTDFHTGFKVQIPGFDKSTKWLNISALLSMRLPP